jgi:hypothetical protein
VLGVSGGADSRLLGAAAAAAKRCPPCDACACDTHTPTPGADEPGAQQPAPDAARRRAHLGEPDARRGAGGGRRHGRGHDARTAAHRARPICATRGWRGASRGLCVCCAQEAVRVWGHSSTPCAASSARSHAPPPHTRPTAHPRTLCAAYVAVSLRHHHDAHRPAPARPPCAARRA